MPTSLNSYSNINHTLNNLNEKTSDNENNLATQSSNSKHRKCIRCQTLNETIKELRETYSEKQNLELKASIKRIEVIIFILLLINLITCVYGAFAWYFVNEQYKHE